VQIGFWISTHNIRSGVRYNRGITTRDFIAIVHTKFGKHDLLVDVPYIPPLFYMPIIVHRGVLHEFFKSYGHRKDFHLQVASGPYPNADS
jgi:hypothetical protein